MYINHCKLNVVSILDRFFMPRTEKWDEFSENAESLSKLDTNWEYSQMPMTLENISKTTFINNSRTQRLNEILSKLLNATKHFNVP